jgi:hypothetical protein
VNPSNIDTYRYRIDSYTAFYPAPFNFYSLCFSHLTLRFHLDHTLKMSSPSELDSSFLASALAESISTSQNRTKWRSPAWEYCRSPTKEENQAYLYCAHCTDLEKSPYGTSIAQNMKKHLKGHYQIIIEKVLSKNHVAVNLQLKQYY